MTNKRNGLLNVRSNDLLSSVPSREIIKRAFLKGIKKKGLDDWLNEMVAHWECWEIYKQRVKNILGR